MTLIPDPTKGAPPGNQTPGQDGQPPAGNQTPPGAFDFRPLLPEDIRGEKTFESFSTVKDQAEFVQKMARSYHSAQGLIGKKGVTIPTETSTAEEKAAFFKAIGVPDKAEEYKIELTGDEFKDFKLDDKRVAAWKKELHANGIPSAAANKLIAAQVREEQGLRAAHNKMVGEWEAKAIAQFGANMDKKLNSVQYALREFDKSGEIYRHLESTGLGSHPEVLAMLATIGETLAEKGPRGGGGGNGAAPHNMAPDQAQVEIQSFERTYRDALFKEDHPDHDFAVKRRRELFLAAYPAAKG